MGAHVADRLTVIKIEKGLLGKIGMHPDGAGLYLCVQREGHGSWLHRYRRNGRERQAGLGKYPDVSLKAAREKRNANRALLAQGIDPLDQQRGPGITLRAAAAQYIASHQAGWISGKHAGQWAATLDAYAYPLIGDKPVHEISRDDVLAVLGPIWRIKTETASRVRGRIEAIIDAVAVAGLTSRNERERNLWSSWVNPASWKHLKHALPRRRKVRPVVRHAAVPYGETAEVMAALRAARGIGALALQFAILTAARCEMVMGARWQEIKGDIWDVPLLREGKGSGLKGIAPMRIPLSPAAMAILELVRPLRREDHGDYIFPGTKHRGISNATMGKALRSRLSTARNRAWVPLHVSRLGRRGDGVSERCRGGGAQSRAAGR